MRPTFSKATGAVVLATVVVLTVSGCSAGQTPPYFDTAQNDDDVLPGQVKAGGIDADSVRYLGKDTDGVEYFAAQTSAEAAPGGTICLVMVAPGDVWTSGCTDVLPVTVQIPSGKSGTLFPDEIPAEVEVTERVGEYVQVEP